MKRFGLRARFALLLGVILLLLFTTFVALLSQQTVTTLRSNLNQKSKIFAQLATKPIGDTFVLYQDSGTGKITRQAQRFFDLDADVRSVLVINNEGRVLYQYGDDGRVQVNLPEGGNFDPYYTYSQDGLINQIIYPFIEDFGGHRYSLVYTISSNSIAAQIDQVLRLTVLFGVIALFVAVILTYFLFSRMFIAPVRRVSQLAAVVSAGNLNQQITSTRHDEIGDLARAVNTMADKLKADIAKLKETDRLKNEFMMITSHNLRTPLTIIRSYIDMAQTDKDSAKVAHYLKTIQANVAHLNQLTEDIITISSIEGGNADFGLTLAPLRPLLEQVAKDFRPMADTKPLTFIATDKLADQQVALNPGYLKNALGNILDNAYKFTKEGGTVTMTAVAQAQGVKISIQDTGVGISAEEIPKLFTKFHRSTDTLKYDYEGVGIGLYLTKLIIEKHGGSIEVESKLNAGTVFKITLPVVMAAATKASS